MNEERERTPREEAAVQVISLLALMLAATLAPMVERFMSDPDVAYRVRWHLKHARRMVELRLHETGVAVETAVGLWQIEESLRKEWRSHADPS